MSGMVVTRGARAQYQPVQVAVAAAAQQAASAVMPPPAGRRSFAWPFSAVA